MLLTPPDAISQTLLAVPMWLLFEVGLLCSRLFVHKDAQPAIVDEEPHFNIAIIPRPQQK
jgi:Sec-independent protein secretion pathway component TatC